MDSRSHRPVRTRVQRLRSLWHPLLWVPATVLVIGIVITLLTANLMVEHTRTLAEQTYHAQHDALVSRLHAQAANASPGNESEVGEWLASVFPAPSRNQMAIRVDTLERHSKTPLFQAGTPHLLDGSQALRSEVNLPGHRWLITTMPDRSSLVSNITRTRNAVWLAGLLITLTGVALTLVLCARVHRLRTELSKQAWVIEKLEGHRDSSQVEKSILRQALNDSEQRSRDLVVLAGAIIGELDEQGCIGFISADVADWLEQAPADLANSRFEDLVSPDYRANLHRALEAARRERQVQRIDLNLAPASGSEQVIPVTMRVLALRDPLHGFTGYRFSAQPGMLVRA
ncbi:PAS domain-containing protein [Marinobacter sp.]|uniref:PAS domain-containing protein n=1 Tax=Marinobacter sp. TaxID=50741 RepID=UPI0034A252A8